MEKKWLMFLSLIFIVLAGCTDQSKDENEDSIIKEHKEDNEQAVSSTSPPDLLIIVGAHSTLLKLSNYCWMKEDCNLSERDIEEILEDERPIQANIGENVTFNLQRTSENLTFPDSIEVTKYYKGEETTVESSNNSINAPEETGYHLYRLHAKWEGEEVYGEANYVFSLFVQE